MDAQESIWLAQYRNGDVEALGRLVEHYRKPLFAFILRMTQDGLKAEEVFQEVWFKAIRRLDSFKENSLLSWLFRIAHNHLIDLSRKKKPDASLQDPRGGEDERTLEDLVESPLPGPEQLLTDRDISRKIAAAVANLPPEQREVFLMRTEGDLSFKEIAEIQGVSINTALGRMQYALARLRQALQGVYDEIREER